MGERIQLRVFKGCNADQFRAALESLLSTHGGGIAWNTKDESLGAPCRLSHSDSVHTLWIPYRGGHEFLICKELGTVLDVPWMELRIQEGSLWDYNLFRGPENLDNFSTLPEYWDDDLAHLEHWRGRPDLLAHHWAVPLDRVSGYLVQWGYRNVDDDTFEHTVKGKAYESDLYEYGDIWQVVDFLGAIGGVYPLGEGHSDHRIRIPPREAFLPNDAAGKTKPWWRFW